MRPTLRNPGAIVAGLALSLAACAGRAGKDGADGTDGRSGAAALVKVSPEPEGVNCARGGVKVETGLDADGDGVLDPGEENAGLTSYVCNGANALVRTDAEPVGSSCPLGGTRIETGIDANRNGVLDPGEVDPAQTTYVCVLGLPGGAVAPSTGIHVQLKAVSTAPGAPVTVRFLLKDDRGFPVDVAGVYSLNAPIHPRFALGSFTRDGTTGIVSPLSMVTRETSAGPPGQPTRYDPIGAAFGHGTLVENGAGAGDFTYTFPTASTPGGPVAVAYDPARLDATHVLWVEAPRQTNLGWLLDTRTFDADHVTTTFVPSGAAAPASREIVSAAACARCHPRLDAETPATAGLHGGGRLDGGSCGACHNPDLAADPTADAAGFIHRIHAGEGTAAADRFRGIGARYPRDVRECAACHAGAAQGGQSLTNPTRVACQGCHAYVSFTGAAGVLCATGGALVRGGDGTPAPCDHFAGPQADDSACATCHGPAGGFPTAGFHRAVTPPAPDNAWLVLGGSTRAPAWNVASPDAPPPGADVLTYEIKAVDTAVDPNNGVRRPRMTFKVRRNGAPVVFQVYAPGANPPVVDLLPGFVGGPTVAFAFAVPQDGNPAPADFNAFVSAYLRRIWDGSATGFSGGTLGGPDLNGDYTVTLTGVQIPASATMLTGALGPTDAILTNPAFVQITVPGYPWVPNVPADGKAQGGVSVAPPVVSRVATGHGGRRAIVDTARCKACHGALGVAPTFHAGLANDAPSCAFCHTPNRTSAGWSVASGYAVHGIHGGRARAVDYVWYRFPPPERYLGALFPKTALPCTACHLPGTHDLTAPGSLEAHGRKTLVTVGAGRYNADPGTNPLAWFRLSPYVVADNVLDYGAGFSFNGATAATTEAASTTLILSPLVAACASCHDRTAAVEHMKANGGRFYAPRSAALSPGATPEQCLVCHGPGRVAAIGVSHPR